MKIAQLKNPRYHTFLSIALIFVATVIFWHPLIFLNKTLFFDLTTKYFYPIAAFFKQAILSKQNPLWNPFIYSGTPFLANPQAGVFYPFTYIFVFFDFPSALNIYIILHTFLAGAFMYFLARHFNLSHIGAVVSAFLFMFNGFFIYHMEFVSNIASYIWIPLIVLFFDKYFKERDFQYLLSCAVFLTLQFLGGMPAFSYYTALLLFVYFIFINPSIKNSFPEIKKAAAYFLALISMFLLFAMVQILPLIELTLNSVRSSGLDYQSVTGYSIRIKDYLAFLLLPLWNVFKPFWEGDIHVIGFYFGIVSLAILILFLFRNQAKKKIFFLIVFLACSLLSLGKYASLVYDAFYNYFPLFKYFRFPAQLMYVVSFAFALIIAFSIENVKNTYLKAALVLLIFCELYLFGIKANTLVDKSYYAAKTPNIEYLKCDNKLYRFMLDPALRKDKPLYVKDNFNFCLNYKDMLYPNTGMAYRFFDVDGFETLRLKNYDDILNKIDNPYSKLLDMLNMKYLFTRHKLSGSKYKLVRDGDTKIYYNKEYLPRFFMVDKAKYLPNSEILNYMAGETFNPEEEVILEETESKPEKTEFDIEPKKAFYYIEGYKLNEIELLLTAIKPLWLITSEVFYPGWEVSIDGKKANLLKVNYAFKGVYASKGTHRIKFYYNSITFKTGAGISFISLLLALIFEVILGYKNRKKKIAAKAAINFCV